MKTIKQLLESDKRGTKGYEIIDDKTIIINNSIKYPGFTEAQQFIDIIQRNWCRDDIFESIGDAFADRCKITFRVSINEEIETF